MSRQAAARSRTESTSRSSRLPATGTTPKFCILDCEDEDHEPRLAMKDSDLCAVCSHRIARQAEMGEAWVSHRKKQVGSWVGGFDYIPAKKRGR